MALRVTITESEDLTVIRVDGRLSGDGVSELDAVCRAARRPVAVDLANLTQADEAGVALLRWLDGAGIHVLGVSPYIALRLSSAAEAPARGRRRRGQGRSVAPAAQPCPHGTKGDGS